MLRATALALACLASGSAFAVESPTYGPQARRLQLPAPTQAF